MLLERLYIKICVCWLVVYLLVYYRLFPTESSVSSGNSLTGSDSVHFVDDDTYQEGMSFISYQRHPHYFPSFFISQMCLIKE